MRAKYQFMFHLSSRGYYGTIHFNHGERRLDLMVQTDDQLATQGKRDKDPRSLSGGEKSFSTICLLLSLWEAIGCPIRCLDEFDVGDKLFFSLTLRSNSRFSWTLSIVKSV